MQAFSPILAQVTGGEGMLRETFEFARVHSNPALWLLIAPIFVAVLAFVGYMYYRDSIELAPGLAVFLAVLRMAVFFGLLVLFLEPQWRIERDFTYDSRVFLLVDTSASMKEPDVENPIDGARTRLRQVAAALSSSEFLNRLRQKHVVDVYRFNDGVDPEPVCTLPKLDPDAADGEDPTAQQTAKTDGANGAGESVTAESTTVESTTDKSADEKNAIPIKPDGTVDWYALLQPGGEGTQLGASLKSLVDEASSKQVAGIVVFSDGGQTPGPKPSEAYALAKRNELPIFTVGIGSDRDAVNVRVSGLEFPKRIYSSEAEKKDPYEVTGYVEAKGLAGRTVQAQLYSRPAAEGAAEFNPSGQQPVATETVTLQEDGTPALVKMRVDPQPPGRYKLHFRISAPAGDRYADDNAKEGEIEIVDRKTRVLLMAGGPTREYRFLRTQLHRDPLIETHVLLQTAQEGISQEADEVLDNFPVDETEMFEYDCVIAFDADWTALTAGTSEKPADLKARAELLERWVAEQGGGLILIGGPVNTTDEVGGWLEDENLKAIRTLYPVLIQGKSSPLDEGMSIAEERCRIEFTKEGADLKGLMLDESLTISRKGWEAFTGVYAFCPVKSEKRGATVLARFDTTTDALLRQTGEQPPFMVRQSFGSGYTFYIGSGEMWRLRALDDKFFQKFYVNLIRHVSQGRQMRESRQGMLMVDQSRYMLGDTVEVTAQLLDDRRKPLDVPQVVLKATCMADKSQKTHVLTVETGKPGQFEGRFPVLEKGEYWLELRIPGSPTQRLTEKFEVEIPQWETARLKRNDELLRQIAKGSWGARPRKDPDAAEKQDASDDEEKKKADAGPGEYYDGIAELLDPPAPKQRVEDLLFDRTKTDPQPQKVDHDELMNWRMWWMIGLCGLLSIEWLTRRLAKLA